MSKHSRLGLLLVLPVLALGACASTGVAPTSVDPLATPPAAEVSRDISPYRVAVAQRNYAAAVNGLKPVVQAYPEDVDAKLLLAEAYLGLADTAQAGRLYGEAGERATTAEQRAEASTGLGLIALYEGEPARAETQFRAALADNRRSALAWNGLGQSLDRQGDHEGAEGAFSQALGLRPEWVAAKNNLGLAQLHAGSYKRAEQTLLDAHHIDPASPIIANNLRLAVALQGDYDEALAGVQPDDEADALNNVGYAALVRGDLGAAGLYLTRAQHASPSFHSEADSNLRLLESLRAQGGGKS